MYPQKENNHCDQNTKKEIFEEFNINEIRLQIKGETAAENRNNLLPKKGKIPQRSDDTPFKLDIIKKFFLKNPNSLYDTIKSIIKKSTICKDNKINFWLPYSDELSNSFYILEPYVLYTFVIKIYNPTTKLYITKCFDGYFNPNNSNWLKNSIEELFVYSSVTGLIYSVLDITNNIKLKKIKLKLNFKINYLRQPLVVFYKKRCPKDFLKLYKEIDILNNNNNIIHNNLKGNEIFLKKAETDLEQKYKEKYEKELLDSNLLKKKIEKDFEQKEKKLNEKERLLNEKEKKLNTNSNKEEEQPKSKNINTIRSKIVSEQDVTKRIETQFKKEKVEFERQLKSKFDISLKQTELKFKKSLETAEAQFRDNYKKKELEYKQLETDKKKDKKEYETNYNNWIEKKNYENKQKNLELKEILKKTELENKDVLNKKEIEIRRYKQDLFELNNKTKELKQDFSIKQIAFVSLGSIFLTIFLEIIIILIKKKKARF